MSTTEYIYDASKLQWSNWKLPEDAETVALAAVRDAGGELDYNTEYVDGELEVTKIFHLNGTQYHSARVERLSLSEFAVTFGTDPGWEPEHDGFSRKEFAAELLEYVKRAE